MGFSRESLPLRDTSPHALCLLHIRDLLYLQAMGKAHIEDDLNIGGTCAPDCKLRSCDTLPGKQGLTVLDLCYRT